MAKRSSNYTDAEILQALGVLRLGGGDVERAAKACGVPKSTLEEWAKGRGQRVAAIRAEADSIYGALLHLRRADVEAHAERLRALVVFCDTRNVSALSHLIKTWLGEVERERTRLKALSRRVKKPLPKTPEVGHDK